VSERLERVTAFSELATGMKVVDIGCVCGRRECHGMLLHKKPFRLGDAVAYAWEVVPACRPATPGKWLGITADAVAAGHIYRVLDGLEEPSTETAAASGTTRRTPQKERAR
jgi:hypothetical protein